MTRGGKRKGAGRPPVSPEARRVSRSVSMPAGAWDALDAWADEQGHRSRGAAVQALVMAAKPPQADTPAG